MKIYLSVHDIVDTLERKGHLDNRIFNLSTMQEGSRIHSDYQKRKDPSWICEYPINYYHHFKEFDIYVFGRADVVKLSPSLIVEEIKSTVSDLDEFALTNASWHLAQVMFYAYCICCKNDYKEATILLTYLKQGRSKDIKQIEKKVTFNILQDFVDDLLNRYHRFLLKKLRYKEERQDSIIKFLKFPYENIRVGQQNVINRIEKVIDDEENLYIEAPTGTGKTIATLYPAIKKMGENKVDNIFYLTSKNIIKEVAMNTLNTLIEQGLKLKSLEITSKENICFNDKKGRCNPDECPFARNYYDKLFDLSFEMLDINDLLNRDTITAFCYKHKMCPYQFQLDLSKYADVTVMDYNYIFDYHHDLTLDNIREEKLKVITLIDECHNLPKRVKDMYSDTLSIFDVKKAKSYSRGIFFRKFDSTIDKLLISFKALPISYDDINNIKNNISILDEIPLSFLSILEDTISILKDLIKKHSDLIIDELLDFFYKLNNIYYLLTDSNKNNRKNCYIIYLILFKGEIQSIKILNLNSTPIIKEVCEYFKSNIFFSATLSPKNYYKELLGGDKNNSDDLLCVSSPFDRDNRLVLIDKRYSLKYADRNKTLRDVFIDCLSVILAKTGNYFIFCPSFEYLNNLVKLFEKYIDDYDYELLYQQQGMDLKSRDDFLKRFTLKNNQTTIGIVVLGGVFSEGVDLFGDSLIGCIVISVGLPLISFEKDQEKIAFDKLSSEENKINGFDYAYSYPGINRVLQAGGRVIRSEYDKGIILYIDSRYSYSLYKNIIEEIYPDYISVKDTKSLQEIVKEFWRKHHEI